MAVNDHHVRYDGEWKTNNGSAEGSGATYKYGDDANHSIPSDADLVLVTAENTALRTYTLPAAASASRITLVDHAGQVDGGVRVLPASGETLIGGTDVGYTLPARGTVDFASDGSTWTVEADEILMTVDEILMTPVEDYPWDIENDPYPFAGFLPAGTLDNLRFLMLGQDTYADGIYEMGDDAQVDVPTLLIELPSDTDARKSWVGRKIEVAAPLSGNIMSLIFHNDALNSLGVAFRRSPQPAIFGVAAVESDEVDTSQSSEFASTLTSSGGNPVHVLLLGQSTASENGIWIATSERLYRDPTFLLRPGAGMWVYGYSDSGFGIWFWPIGAAPSPLSSFVESDASYTPGNSGLWRGLDPEDFSEGLDYLVDMLEGRRIWNINAYAIDNQDISGPFDPDGLSGTADTTGQLVLLTAQDDWDENGLYSVQDDNGSAPVAVSGVKGGDFFTNLGGALFTTSGDTPGASIFHVADRYTDRVLWVVAVLDGGGSETIAVDGSQATIDGVTIHNNWQYLVVNNGGVNEGVWEVGAADEPWHRMRELVPARPRTGGWTPFVVMSNGGNDNDGVWVSYSGPHDGNWNRLSYGTQGMEALPGSQSPEVTVSDLNTLAGGNNLIVGRQYIVTDVAGDDLGGLPAIAIADDTYRYCGVVELTESEYDALSPPTPGVTYFKTADA